MSNPKATIIVFAVFVAVAMAFFLFSEIIPPKAVVAGSGHNVSGFAWSENIGWVSFNSTNVGGGADYGVNIADNGVFSGYAWSDNIGWLSFNEAELTGCPSGACRAWVGLDTGEASGWAKALAFGGWLRLRDTNYGVSINKGNGRFQGWAWGDDSIGWLSFSGPQYRTETSFAFNNPPSAQNLSVERRDYCSTPSQYFKWQFQDPDPGDAQSAYQIQVDKEGDFAAFGPGELDSGKTISSSYEKLVLVARTPDVGQLGYNTQYYWRVKVWDKKDAPSQWSAGPSFTTPPHLYPSPNFKWLPSAPSKGEVVQLCATRNSLACSQFTEAEVSNCYGAGYPSCSGKNFLWTFQKEIEFATGSSAVSENPQVKFKTSGAQTISLQVTDDAGGCTTTKPIGVMLPLPKWKEVEP